MLCVCDGKLSPCVSKCDKIFSIVTWSDISPVLADVTVSLVEQQWISSNRNNGLQHKHKSKRLVVDSEPVQHLSWLQNLCSLDFYKHPAQLELPGTILPPRRLAFRIP